MNTAIDSSEHESTSPSGLEPLARAVALNRLMILILTILILVMLTSWLTLGIFHYVNNDAEQQQALLERNEQRLAQAEQRLSEQTAQLEQQQQLLTQLQKRPLSSEPAQQLNTLIAQTLVGQELSYQSNVLAFKNGMRDLAQMIPGSRDWLELYDSALDKAKADSLKRSQALQAWLEQHNSVQPEP